MISGVAARLVKPALALTSFLLTFLVLEVGTRATKWEWRAENFLTGELSWFWAAFPTEYDSRLGWAPRPGANGLDGGWGFNVTVLDGGLRSNGPGRLELTDDARPIVAVGDSFTWGAEVADDQTWPAALERQLGVPVINGGVFGFGVDQSYLRALQLIERFRPSTVILSFIPDDVARCELAVRAGTNKPYFTVDDGALTVHRPEPPPDGDRVGALRRLSGYSFFLYKLLRRTIPQLYLSGGLDGAPVGNDGSDIACQLISRLESATGKQGIELLVVLQDGGPAGGNQRLADLDELEICLGNLGGRFLNLRRSLREMGDGDPDRYAAFFTEHMTPAGNNWVAEQVAEALAGTN